MISSQQRGVNEITQDGLDALSKAPAHINTEFLSQYPTFQGFREERNEAPVEPGEAADSSDKNTPEEIIGGRCGK